MKKQNYKEEKFLKHCLANALLDLMKIFPFDDISIKEICGKANVARATYYHYASGKHGKEHLLEFKVIKEFQNFVQKRRELGFPKNESDDCIAFVYENREMFKLLYNNHLYSVFVAFINYANTWETSPGDSKYLLSYITFGCLGVIYEMIKNDFEQTPQEVEQIIFNKYQEILQSFFKKNEAECDVKPKTFTK